MSRPLLFPQVVRPSPQPEVDPLKATLERLKQNPNDVARGLRELHEERRPERFRALIYIHDSINGEGYISDSFFQQLVESELPKLSVAMIRLMNIQVIQMIT